MTPLCLGLLHPFDTFFFYPIDGRGPSTNPKESQTSRHIGPTTRTMAKRLEEGWNIATDGRETYLYMFQVVQIQA